MMKLAAALSTCALAAAATAQVVAPGETYNVTFFGSGDGGFVFASPWANTVVNFDGAAETATGQPTAFGIGNVGDPVSYSVTESTFANGDGTYTIRVEISSDAEGGFLAPGLDFDGFSGGVQTLDTFTFDLGATTFGTNNGVAAANGDIQFLSANIQWLANGQVLVDADATQRIGLNVPVGGGFQFGGLRGQFSVSDAGGDIGAYGLDHIVLDMVVTPAPGATALFAAGGLLAARRRRA